MVIFFSKKNILQYVLNGFFHYYYNNHINLMKFLFKKNNKKHYNTLEI